MSRLIKRGLLATVACLACGLFAAPAQASFHLTQIREYFTGNFGAAFNDSYVELQAYAPGQNLVGGHTLTVYDHNGTATPTVFSGNVSNGQNQATILIGDSSISGSSDATNIQISTIQTTGGGAICWENIDCVSIGTGPGPAVLPSPAGPPAPFASDGMALRRTIARGCATALDAPDDTNNSAADFSLTTPLPRNNAAPITEKPCASGGGGGGGANGPPNTKIKKRPKNQSHDKTPTFKFGSDESNSTFKCKLDRKKFKKCKSPKTLHVHPGSHTFKVEAIDSTGAVDKTPAKDKFKVLP
jgi:hypothetical protein